MRFRKIKLFLISFVFIVFAYYLSPNAYYLPPIASIYAEESSKEMEALFVAKKAFEDGFYEVSLDLLERFLKDYPHSTFAPEAELLSGQCYFHQGKFLEALKEFEGLLNNPKAKEIKDAVFYWIAEVHFKGNNFNKAAQFYKAIIDEFPKSSYGAAAHYSLGWCRFQEQDFKEALTYFKAVEERFPKNEQARDVPFKIIECLYNLKDYSGLKEKSRNYLKLYAKDTTGLSYLYFYAAEADYYLNNLMEAVERYSKVLANTQDPKIQALSRLGICWSYLKLKRYKEAEEAFLAIKMENLEKRSQDSGFLARGLLLAETNRINEAKNLYDHLLDSTNDPVVLMQAYLGKADALYNLADYEGAISVYKEALSKNESGTAAPEIMDKLHYGLSWSYLKQGEFKEAIREFQKIARESDDKVVKVSALCQIGDAYQDQGDYAKAQETYDTILKDYPDSLYGDYVQYQLGLTLLKANNYNAAALSFLALKRNFPDSKLLDDATYALGLAYFQGQDYNSSKEVFEKFNAEFQDSSLKAHALYLLGTSLYNLRKFSEAIEVFKNVIRLYGQESDLVQKAEYEIADCFYQMGDEKEAMARFKSLRSKYPDSGLTAEIMWWLGEYYYRNDDLALSRRYFSSLIQDFPKSNLVADAYYALGSTYAKEESYDEARENFKKAIELGKADLKAQAAIALAGIHARMDNLDEALKTYKDIVNDYPNLTSIIYPELAGLLYKKGNYDEALDFYRKCLEAVPVKEMPSVQLKIAEVLEAKGLSDEAVSEYLKVTYLYSENKVFAVRALLRIAEIYEGKENFKEAVNIYKRILSMDVEEAKYAKERIDWITEHGLK
ncbi:MAG: tetratricopeptide repeat protein [Candidatus Omnitrophota bacterium]